MKQGVFGVCQRSLVVATLVALPTAFAVTNAEASGWKFKTASDIDWTNNNVILALATVGINPKAWFPKVTAAVSTTTDFNNTTLTMNAYNRLWLKSKGRLQVTYTRNDSTALKQWATVVGYQLNHPLYQNRKQRLFMNLGLNLVRGHSETTLQTTNYTMPVNTISLNYQRRSSLGQTKLSVSRDQGGDFLFAKGNSTTTAGVTPVDITYRKYTINFSQRFKLPRPWSAMLEIKGQNDPEDEGLALFAKMASNSPLTPMYFDRGVQYTLMVGYQFAKPILHMQGLDFTASRTNGYNKANSFGYKDANVTDLTLEAKFKPIIFGLKPFARIGGQNGNPVNGNKFDFQTQFGATL